jgi:hypothetical protein
MLPRLPEGVAGFVVVQEGSFQGRTHAAGSVLVCRGDAAHADATVLVATGHGRPRLGTVLAGRLVGDAGEPCHPARWRSAGRLVASYELGVDGWVVRLLGVDEVQPTGPQRPARRQLSLFAA